VIRNGGIARIIEPSAREQHNLVRIEALDGAVMAIRDLLEEKPGRDDPTLATGDLGIRSGYWYLEGDERSHPDGRFRTMAVKGVEIRTPPCPDIAGAIAELLAIEAQLTEVLARHRRVQPGARRL